MADNWCITEKGLNRAFRFKSFSDLTEFLCEIAKTADRMDHHPDLEVRKAVLLNVHLLTHDAKAITAKDYELSEVMDSTYLAFKFG